MKRINYIGGSVITSDAIAASLLDYSSRAGNADMSVTLEFTALEESGETSIHTLLLHPPIQFDVLDSDPLADGDEDARFPLPDFPPPGISGEVEHGDQGRRSAAQFDTLIHEIDEGLGR